MNTVILSCMLLLGAADMDYSNWGTAMFDTTSHDFGVVVRGAKVEHEFVLTNKYKEDVEIASVHSSCQCTTPVITRRGPIKSWEKTSIKISVNTVSFTGNKNATITVRFTKPYPMEVQLHSYVFIRTDISVSPGLAYFGIIPQGVEYKLPMNVNYAGRQYNWKINDIQSTCEFLSVKVRELGRSGSRVNYGLTVYVKENAPPGSFNEFLELVTNDPDPRNQRFPIAVSGMVRQPLSASPSPLSFGIVEAGKQVTKTLVLQAQDPFQIKDIKSEDLNITASVTPGSRQVQQVRLRYTGTEVEGPFTGSIIIETDLAETPDKTVIFNGRSVVPQQVHTEISVVNPGEADTPATSPSSADSVEKPENPLATEVEDNKTHVSENAALSGDSGDDLPAVEPFPSVKKEDSLPDTQKKPDVSPSVIPDTLPTLEPVTGPLNLLEDVPAEEPGAEVSPLKPAEASAETPLEPAVGVDSEEAAAGSAEAAGSVDEAAGSVEAVTGSAEKESEKEFLPAELPETEAPEGRILLN